MNNQSTTLASPSLLHRVARKVARVTAPNPPTQTLAPDQALDFIRWATPGMCGVGNVYAFDWVARRLNAITLAGLPVLEIGSWCGQSALVLSHLIARHGSPRTKVYTCDPWNHEEARREAMVGDTDLTHGRLYDWVLETFKRNCRFFLPSNRLPYSFRLSSQAFLRNWEAGASLVDVFNRPVRLGQTRFSFCFIDGNHQYEPTIDDFRMCDRNLAIGGFLLFDDSSGGNWPGVERAVAEVLATGRYETVMWNPHLLVRKVRDWDDGGDEARGGQAQSSRAHSPTTQLAHASQ